MAYITTDQLSQRLGTTLYARLTDRVNGATASSTVAQQIVDEAQALADSYLGRRYQTPVDLALHPELTKVLAARVLDLAESAAWRGSPFVADPPARVAALLADAVRWFEDVAAGRVVLPAVGPIAGSPADDDGPRHVAAPRVFTAAELDGL